MKSELKRVGRSIIIRAAGVTCIAVGVSVLLMIVFVDGLLEQFFIGSMVRFFVNALNMDFYSAMALYENVFSNNKVYWVMAGFMLVLILCFYLCRSWFSRDFALINQGLDTVAAGEGGGIALPDELSATEKKLHAINALIERKEREAKEAEQRKNDLIVYLAHDIKTPLTSIIGYLNLLSETRDLPREQLSRYVDLTLEKSYRLEQLIDEFFDITRFNLQTIVLNRQQLDLCHMLDQLADEFYPILAEQGKTIAVKAPESMMISADADKLARVFNNILKNAMSYSYPNSEIEVAAGMEGENAVIRFTNKGDPIPPESLETIFEKFYRLDAARSSDTGNAGLGLAIAREIAIAHDGSITAKSEKDSTVFTVSIPIAY